MSNAKIDENGVATLIAVSKVNGTTIDVINADPSTHRLEIASGTSGTDHGTQNAKRDQNSKVALMGVSSSDGVTPIPIYSDGNGRLLVDFN